MANSQQVPVGVERNPGMLTPASGNPGAGFWFQMFTFRAGSKLVVDWYPKGRQPKLLPQSKGYPQRLASWTELTHKEFTQADQ